MEPLHIGAREFECRNERVFWIASLTAHIAGVAVVWNGTTVAAYGTDPSLAFWKWPYAMNAAAEALDLLGPPDTRLRRVHQVRAWRISLLRLQHRVALEHPELRAPNQPGMEVVLKPSAGKLRLGGCVWTEAAYETEAGRRFLGF